MSNTQLSPAMQARLFAIAANLAASMESHIQSIGEIKKITTSFGITKIVRIFVMFKQYLRVWRRTRLRCFFCAGIFYSGISPRATIAMVVATPLKVLEQRVREMPLFSFLN